jgi:hypothetical protein
MPSQWEVIMATEFSGKATRMTEEAIARAADALGCEVAAVKAVIDVESRGGFLDDNRPKILFERHYFCRLTNGKHDPVAPEISSPAAGGYQGGKREYDRLAAAIKLDREAALKSASWGAFQIMGANYKAVGFPDVESFCKAMCESEDNQLAAFVGFVKANKLDDELRRHDWAGFARGYNGPAYQKNRYDEKLAAAYFMHAGGGARTNIAGGSRTLRMGDDGDDVARLQERLGLRADGDFGPQTKAAVVRFQQANGLAADGVVGPRTRAKLGL